MTGFGDAHISKDGIDLDVEIKSINGRFLDLRFILPRELSFFEYKIRKHISNNISRGTVEIRINYNDYREPKLVLDKIKLLKYNELAIQASNLLSSEEVISIEFLLQEPGVIMSENHLEDDPILANILNECLVLSLQKITESMHKEGEQIKSVLQDSMLKIKNIVASIYELCEPFKKAMFENMHKRILELLESYQVENMEQRLMQEVAIYVDKYDVAEELTRLIAHINTFQNTLQEEGDIGKTLNFIIQEMQREANTLGSKFSTPQSFPLILAIKEEIEKCREIVQNVA